MKKSSILLVGLIMVLIAVVFTGCASTPGDSRYDTSEPWKYSDEVQRIKTQYPEGGLLVVVGYNNEVWFDAEDLYENGTYGYIVVTYNGNRYYKTNNVYNQYQYTNKTELEELKTKLGLN